MYKRDVGHTIVERLNEERKFIQVIMGPRQVGKTTAILQILKDIKYESHYVAADLPAPPDLSWISMQWDVARRSLKKKEKFILVLDEVQKIAHWSREVKRLWDEDTRLENNIHLVILGSSSLLISRGLDESLAGRFEIIRFPHWSWLECKKCFNLSIDEYIYFGGYPGALVFKDDENRFRSYLRDSLIETALSKDVLLINRVEKPALLRQLFVLACNYGGQILSYQKILGQLQDAGNTTTLAHYQNLLEAAFLIKGLQRFSTKLLRQRNSTPKWLPLNTALMTALSDSYFKDVKSRPEIWGRLVEVAIGAHIVNSSASVGVEVYYWRRGNEEVDFIVKKGEKIIAIEVKSGNDKDCFSGLKEFCKEHKEAKLLVVGGGEMSVVEFLEMSFLDIF